MHRMKSSLFLQLLVGVIIIIIFYSYIHKPISPPPIPIFKEGQQEVTSYPLVKSDQIIIMATGDVMLGRSVNTNIQKQKNYSFPFAKILDLFKGSDLTIVNLESPFFSPCPPTDKGMIFCADPKSIQALSSIKVTAANLANNHINNYGQEGIKQTLDVLSDNNIYPVGALRATPEIVTIKNTKIALLGFNDIPPYPKGINQLTETNLVNQIKEAKKNTDLVIVSIHWGNEYSMASKRQKQFAHLAIDNGADLIIGHHPHWVQEIEEYKGKLIYYSLGNFVFDQMWSEKTKLGLVAKVTFQGNKIATHSAIPIKINSLYQPEILNFAKINNALPSAP